MENSRPYRTAKIVKWFSPLAAVFLVLGLLIAIVDAQCFSKSFYRQEYEKLDTAAYIGMSQTDLDSATGVLLDYLRGKRDDLTVYAEINGAKREVFNQREKLHMQDVRTLYQKSMALGYWMLAAGTLFFAWALLKKMRRRNALQGYIQGNALFLCILGVLGLYAVLDFYTFWTTFHQMFFSNDLWLLNPETDILILMVPEQFFFDLVMRIAVFSAGAVAALLAGAAWWKRRLRTGEE
jgi:integral membrane protein (TIGR01906 family)